MGVDAPFADGSLRCLWRTAQTQAMPQLFNRAEDGGSAMIWKRDEDTAVVCSDTARSKTDAWGDEPEPPEPLEIFVWGVDRDGYQGSLSEPGTRAYIDLDGDDLEGLRDLAIPLEACR